MNIHRAAWTTLGSLAMGLFAAGLSGEPSSVRPDVGPPHPDTTPLVWVATRLNDEAWAIDPSTNAVVARVRPPRGSMPEAIAASDDAVWMMDYDGWLHRIDPATRARTTSVRGLRGPHALAVSPAGVWMANGDWWIVRLDPATNALADSVEIVAGIYDLAFHGGTLWVATDVDGGHLLRVPPGATAVSDSIPLDWVPAALASGAEGLWGHDPYAGVVFSVTADGVRGPIDLGSRGYEGSGLDIGPEAAWVSLGTENAVARVEILSGAVSRIDVGGFVEDVAYGAGAVWAALPEDDLLVRIDPSTGGVVARISVAGYPVAVAVR